MSATAIGPGVGGINECVTARPAKSGKAYISNDFLVCLCKAYIMGNSKINATSKNTGIATIKPAIAMAAGALSTPNFFNKKDAMTLAPPECSNMAPNIAPKPTTVATNPKVLAIPSLIVFIIAKESNPAIRPTTILAINKEAKA